MKSVMNGNSIVIVIHVVRSRPKKSWNCCLKGLDHAMDYLVMAIVIKSKSLVNSFGLLLTNLLYGANLVFASMEKIINYI